MRLEQLLVDQAIIARNFFHVTLLLRRLRAPSRSPVAPPAPGRFAIIAGDVSNPAGSLGDMAMFTALMQSLRARNAAATFTIIGARNHSISVPGIGDVPVVAAWAERAGAMAFDALVRQHDALFVMGADILDGKYGAALVQRIASYCNHSIRLGIPVTTLGFSFNRHPRRPTVQGLAGLHPKVKVNVRDQPSLDRFTRLVGIPAQLCADSAFLMSPAVEAEPEAEAWIAGMRASGLTPIGINLNAHALAPAIAAAGPEALIEHIATQLRSAGERNALAYMLIPHDLKPQSGDVVMLQKLEQSLQRNGFAQVRYTSIGRPDKIKRIAGLLDFIITGRMHLAIAALGSGTPILSIAYQDKFEGLYEHFGLSLEYIISPMQCLGDEFLDKINFIYSQRAALRERVHASLPRVKELALRNLEFAL